MLKKEYIVEIEKVVYSGEGMTKVDNLVVFIDGVLPHEKARIRIREIKKHYARGEVIEIFENSEYRIQPFCPYFQKCGGCHWQMVDYPYQLRLKRDIVIESFERISKIKDLPILPTVPSPKIHNYRNKIVLSIKRLRDKILLGFKEKRSDKIVDIENCPVAYQQISSLIRPVKGIIANEPITIYDPKRHFGKLRKMIIRGSERTMETLMLFITKNWGISKTLAQKFTNLDPEKIVGVCESINPTRGDTIFFEKTKKILGESFYRERVGKRIFKVSSVSFFQINVPLLELLYNDMRDLMKNRGEILVDAHTGVGIFAILYSSFFKKVIGIDVVGPAIADAEDNKNLNDALNVEFYKCRAEDAIPSLPPFDTIILDPPREGVNDDLIYGLSLKKPLNIFYISCNPTTLARDTKKILELGYELEVVKPYDFFPWTFHVETLAVFRRKS